MHAGRHLLGESPRLGFLRPNSALSTFVHLWLLAGRCALTFAPVFAVHLGDTPTVSPPLAAATGHFPTRPAQDGGFPWRGGGVRS